MAKTGALHHIEIYVSDLERSKVFWQWLLTEIFNYQVFQQWDQGISFKLDDSYLVFVQTDEKYNDLLYHRCGTGLNHLAFHAAEKDFIDSLTKQLKEKGIPILYKEKHPYAGGKNYYAVYFEDPDRIKVEVALS